MGHFSRRPAFSDWPTANHYISLVTNIHESSVFCLYAHIGFILFNSNTWIKSQYHQTSLTMVKKGQAKGGKPGGGGGAKKPSPATTTGDDSFIVFSNSDKDPKPKRQAATSETGTSGADILGEAPKRPDVKKIIGGASWTGKLPVNLLSEHCQKQKWDKPEYTMV